MIFFFLLNQTTLSNSETCFVPGCSNKVKVFMATVAEARGCCSIFSIKLINIVSKNELRRMKTNKSVVLHYPWDCWKLMFPCWALGVSVLWNAEDVIIRKLWRENLQPGKVLQNPASHCQFAALSCICSRQNPWHFVQNSAVCCPTWTAELDRASGVSQREQLRRFSTVQKQ